MGGVQEVMRQLAERFVARGHEVTVVTSFLASRQARTLNGVRIVEFRISGNFVSGLSGDVEHYQRYLLGTDFDVLMVKAAQQWTFDALIPVLDRIVQPKVFIPCGFSALYEPAYADYFRRMPEWLRRFDRLIFYASNYRDINFAREHGLTGLTVIPNGASEREFNVVPDQGFRARHRIPEDAFVMLTVGSVTGMKGHLELASAFERCDFGDRQAVLILNGTVPVHSRERWGPLIRRRRQQGLLRTVKAVMRQLLLMLRLRGVLRTLSYRISPADDVRDSVAKINSSNSNRRAVLVDLPRSELLQAYLNSDLFVFASNIEYSPLVLYEAAAAGLPFLSGSVGNAAEIAQWTGGGIVIDAPQDSRGYTHVDPNILAKEIANLAAHPAELARLRARGRSSWEQRFTWDRIAALYENVFESCISEVRI